MSAKSSSTPGELARGILNCLEKISLPAGEIQTFVHGSTVAINTVVERKGAKTALVVTRGTRDVYKIGRGNRPEAYNIWFRRPEPLVPRHLTFEVDERMAASGEVRIPLTTCRPRMLRNAWRGPASRPLRFAFCIRGATRIMSGGWAISCAKHCLTRMSPSRTKCCASTANAHIPSPVSSHALRCAAGVVWPGAVSLAVDRHWG